MAKGACVVLRFADSILQEWCLLLATLGFSSKEYARLPSLKGSELAQSRGP